MDRPFWEDRWKELDLARSSSAVADFPLPFAIDFLAVLIDAVAENRNISNGVQIVSDSSSAVESHGLGNLFTEEELLHRCSTQLNRLSLSELRDSKSLPSKLIVSTLSPFVERKGRQDEVISRLVEVASALVDDGIAILLAPSFHRTFREGHLVELLNAEGIEVMGLINPPVRFLYPRTNLRPLFIVVRRGPVETSFAIDCINFEDLELNIANALNLIESDNLRSGVRIEIGKFNGFEHWYAQREIEALEGEYTKFESFSLNDVALEINLGKSASTFADISTSVYLPLIGKGDAVMSQEKLTMKQQNYCQIIVDTAKATPEFLCNFLNTRHFRLYLEAEKATAHTVIPRLSLRQVRALPIALPKVETQKQITKTLEKLAQLRLMVDELEKNISVNPSSSGSLAKQVDDLLEVLGRLSIEDQLFSMVIQGESKTVEFKQTFSLDVKDNSKNKDLETAAIKTIGAFLNSEGGDLLVGVDDDGKITGIDVEIEKFHKGSRDKFLQHFKNSLRRIGEQFYPKISYDIFKLDGKLVLHVSCEPSDKEVFVDGEKFFVRANPATDQLTGQKLVDYVKRRFQ